MYELRPLPLRQAREFRKRLLTPVNELAGMIGQIEQVEVANLQAIGEVIRSVGQAALRSIDQAAELVFAYSPEIAADRERIENEAFDEEIITAFTEVLAQLYPFGQLRKVLTGLQAQASRMKSA